MDWNYFRSVLVVFLSSFFIFHVIIRGIPFEAELRWSMLVTGLFVIFYVVKKISGAKV